MSSYKLIYFNSKGRAEVARLVFAQAAVRYEDQRISKEEWVQLKQKMPTGMLPVLEVDGKQISGSWIINRFLGERLGLAGSNDLENAEIAGIIDVFTDFMQCMVSWFMEKDEVKKAELQKNIQDNEIPKYLGVLEKICSKSSGGYIYGGKLTYADLAIFNGLNHGHDLVGKAFPNMLEGRPGLTKLMEVIRNLPNIAKWLNERPTTTH